MPEDYIEQEDQLSEDEIISLLSDESPELTKTRKGYDDYVREAAEAEDAGEEEEGAGQGHEKFEMPEKFQGKTAEEIARSYIELQSEYGRRNNEVGSLRKLTDQLLELNTKEQVEQPAPKKKVSVDSLLENPDDAISEVVESNPRLKSLEEKLIKREREDSLKAFEDKFPNWVETLNTPEFQAWIMESPVRQRMFVQADREYDYATGAELLSTYELVRGSAIKAAKQERDTAARTAAKSAVTETSGNSQKKAKPKYRRTELIELKLRDPAKYQAMLPEIMQAYHDKRVI